MVITGHQAATPAPALRPRPQREDRARSSGGSTSSRRSRATRATSTWPKKKAYTGGGAMWNTPAVDPELGLVYIGVGNPIPYSGIKRGPGKELFTESLIALNAKTGKLRWHYQTIHHDIWDYDVTNPVILFDLRHGRMRKGIAACRQDGLGLPARPQERQAAHRHPEKKVPQPSATTRSRRSRTRSATTSPSSAPSEERERGQAGARREARTRSAASTTPYDDKQNVVLSRTRSAAPTGRRRRTARTPATCTSARTTLRGP